MDTETDFLAYLQDTIESLTDVFSGESVPLAESGLALSGYRC